MPADFAWAFRPEMNFVPNAEDDLSPAERPAASRGPSISRARLRPIPRAEGTRLMYPCASSTAMFTSSALRESFAHVLDGPRRRAELLHRRLHARPRERLRTRGPLVPASLPVPGGEEVVDPGEQVLVERPHRVGVRRLHGRRFGGQVQDECLEPAPGHPAFEQVGKREPVEPLEVGLHCTTVLTEKPVEAPYSPRLSPTCSAYASMSAFSRSVSSTAVDALMRVHCSSPRRRCRPSYSLPPSSAAAANRSTDAGRVYPSPPKVKSNGLASDSETTASRSNAIRTRCRRRTCTPSPRSRRGSR